MIVNKRSILIFALLLAIFDICQSQPTGKFIDKRDGKEYKTLFFLDNVWMIENLAYLPKVCNFDNSCGYYVQGYHGNNVNMAKSTNEYKKNGVMYNYKVADKICPPGWRLPTSDEINYFFKRVGILESNSWGEKYKFSFLFIPEEMTFEPAGHYYSYEKRLTQKNEAVSFWLKNGKYYNIFKEERECYVVPAYEEDAHYVRCVKGIDSVKSDFRFLKPQKYAASIQNKVNQQNNSEKTNSNQTKVIDTKQTVDYSKMVFNKTVYANLKGSKYGYRINFPSMPTVVRPKKNEEIWTSTYGDIIFRAHSYFKDYPEGKIVDIDQSLSNYKYEMRRKYGAKSTGFLPYNIEGYSVEGKNNGNSIIHYGFIIDRPEWRDFYIVFIEVESAKKSYLKPYMEKFFRTYRKTDYDPSKY